MNKCFVVLSELHSTGLMMVEGIFSDYRAATGEALLCIDTFYHDHDAGYQIEDCLAELEGDNGYFISARNTADIGDKITVYILDCFEEDVHLEGWGNHDHNA